MNIDVTIINGKKYAEIDRITINKSTYIFLSNVDKENDYALRKLSLVDGELYYNPLDTNEEFDEVLKEFIKKNSDEINK